jgi:lactoylglutathione lyase
MEASLAFYQDLVGLKLMRRFSPQEGVEIAFLGEGETKVELICNGSGEKSEVGSDISWGFETEDLDALTAILEEKGIAIQSGPFSPNPYMRFFYVLDPNGFKIQFVEDKSPK